MNRRRVSLAGSDRNWCTGSVTYCSPPNYHRRFIAASAASAFAFQFFPAGCSKDAPSNRLNLAAIGVGGQPANLKACPGENIVALCDVDWDYAAKTFQLYPGAKKFRDYREMLEKEGD
jgi:hypothetical protein